MNATSVFAGAVGGLFLASAAAMGSPLQGMSMELVNSGDQGNTYRLFANLDAGARIDAVYGNAQGDLFIGTANGGTMYQNANGGPTSKEINSNFFAFVPSLEWDSYVSIGALYQDGSPFGSNNLNNIGINWTSFEGGGDLVTNNGSWFVTPDDAQGNELNGQVFIGQFTVEGGSGDASDIIGQVNLQGKDANGDTWNEVGATWVPAPGALALLGLAGLAGRRRRRA
jgi:MYXO-CTERM domain-containing protein